MAEFNSEEFYNELDGLYASGASADVETFLLERINASRENRGGDNAEHMVCLNELASLYRGQSRFDESFRCYEEAEEILLDLFGESTAHYATFLNNKASAHRMAGDYEKALFLYNKAIRIYKDINETDAYLLAGLLNNVSSLYRQINKNDDAVEALLGAVKMLKSASGLEDELATTMVNLASLYHSIGEGDLAAETLNGSIELFRGLSYESAHYPAALNLLGIIEMKKGNYSGAIDALEQGAGLGKKIFSENIDYATMKKNLGDVYVLTGDTERAINEFGAARSAFVRAMGEDCEAAKELDAKIEGCSRKRTRGKE